MNEQFLPTTDQFPNDPLVKIYTGALGILCFNEEDERAEIGYLDIHDLFISIFDSHNSPVIPPRSSMKDKNLEITSGQTGIGEIFERPNAPENFNLMFELAELYGPGADFANEPDNFQSKLFINDAVFSTHPDSLVDAIPFEQNRPSSTKPVRKTGRILVISTKNRNLSVKFGEEDIPLSPKDSYKILIQNGNCRSLDGDFKFYFDVLKNAGAIRYNLKFVSGGRFSPFTESEQQEIARLSNQAMSSSKTQMEPNEIHEERNELARQLSTLASVFRCPPAACQKVVFANRARAIP